MRKVFVLLLCCFALGGVVGCGEGSKLGGAVVGHHILNHVAPKHKRTINKAFCAYHVYKSVQTFRHGHRIIGVLHGAAALHSCKHGFGH